MVQSHSNPYHVSDRSGEPVRPLRRKRLQWLVGIACLYYAISALTLPFVNKVWIGELPVLAPLQLPKAFIKSIVHQTLLHVVHLLGWSRGSASPDYSMTHPWAMALMATLPAVVLIAVILFFGRDRRRIGFAIAIFLFAALDAVVTLGFDATSNLKLFNAIFL